MADGRLRTFNLLDRSGNVLHSGEAISRRRFVESLIARKVSFAGADLRGYPLNHLEIDGLDFSGADATGASLVGTSACGGNWSGAILRGVQADGFRARNARFAGADMGPEKGEPSRFRGADFSGADMRAGILDAVDMEEACLHAANLSWVRASRAIFKDAVLVNVEHANASYQRCDFSGADLSARVGDNVLVHASRTRGTRAIDCLYKGASMDGGAGAFRIDANMGGMVRAVGLGVSALAVAAAAKWIPEEAGLTVTQGILGQGVLLIAAVGLANWMRQVVEDKTKEHLGRGVSMALRSVTEFVANASRSGVRLAKLCAVMADDEARGLLVRSLSATGARAREAGALDLVASVALDGAEVVLCDRRRLAFALAHLHGERMKGVKLTSDLVLVRDFEGSSDAPSALRFAEDGGMTAVWRGDRGRLRTVSWDRNGQVHASEGFWGDIPTVDRVKAAFEDALWRDHGERRPYLSKSHRLVAGEDGSIQIVHEKTGKLNNPWGFAYLGVEGEMRVYNQGAQQGHLIDGDDIVEETGFAMAP